jgi:hypothetical protein
MAKNLLPGSTLPCGDARQRLCRVFWGLCRAFSPHGKEYYFGSQWWELWYLIFAFEYLLEMNSLAFDFLLINKGLFNTFERYPIKSKQEHQYDPAKRR